METQPAVRVLIIEDSPVDAGLLREALHRADARTRIYQAESLLAGLDRLAGDDIDLVMLDLAVRDNQGLDGLRALHVYAPSVPVVVLTLTDQDSGAIRALQMGAEECLVRGKADAEKVARVLRRVASKAAVRIDSNGGDAKRAAMIGLVGSKGGVGTTTVACHIANELKRQTAGRVLLMDLDTRANSVAFLMKTESTRALLEAANSIMHLDEPRWRDLVSHAEGGVDILPAGGPVCRDDQQPRVERIRCLLRFIRPLYEWIIIDFGRFTPLTFKLCGEMSQILVISSLDPAALNGTYKVARGLRDAGMQAVGLAVNRAPKTPDLTRPEIEKLVDVPLEAMLPECDVEFKEGMSKRQLLGHSKQFSAQVVPLTRKLCGAAEEAADKKLFGLFRLRA